MTRVPQVKPDRDRLWPSASGEGHVRSSSDTCELDSGKTCTLRGSNRQSDHQDRKRCTATVGLAAMVFPCPTTVVHTVHQSLSNGADALDLRVRVGSMAAQVKSVCSVG